MKEYETGRIAFDPVIFTMYDSKIYIRLQKREKNPFEGMFELPGGLLRPDITAEQNLKIKLKENQKIIFAE